MEDKLKEIGRRLEAMATVGDAVTDEPLFAIARELLELRQWPEFGDARVAPRLDLKAQLSIPPEWKRDFAELDGDKVPALVLRASSSDEAYVFDAIVFFVSSLATWRAHVALNGCTVFQYEDESRANSLQQARESIWRAWTIRGPVAR